MNEYPLSDQEQIEMLKKWWNDYGKALAVAILLGLVIGLGWRYWHNQQARKSMQASLIYEQLVIAIGNNNLDQRESLIKTLMAQFPKTPYASLAALFSAQFSVKKNDPQAAVKQFQWVIDHTKDRYLKQIASLRLARVWIANKNTTKALEILKEIKEKPYLSLSLYWQGQVYASLGDQPKAKGFYQLAKKELASQGVQSSAVDLR